MILSAVTLGTLSISAFILAAHSEPLYKGTESIEKIATQVREAGQNSILTAFEASTPQDFSDVLSENKERLAKAKKPYEEALTVKTNSIPESNQPAKQRLCTDSQTPIIVTGTFMGCTTNEHASIPVIAAASFAKTLFVATAPPPTVRPLTGCEAEGKETYLGEDKPGLLYGMCI